MQTELRKIHLIEAILKVDKETTLSMFEPILFVMDNKQNDGYNISSIDDFVGIISLNEADEMSKAIQETCEMI